MHSSSDQFLFTCFIRRLRTSKALLGREYCAKVAKYPLKPDILYCPRNSEEAEYLLVISVCSLYLQMFLGIIWTVGHICQSVICMWLHWSHIVLFCEANFIIRLLFPVDSTSCCVVSTCWPFGYNCFLLILNGTRPSVCILSIMSQVNNQSANPSVVILLIHYTGIVAANTWPSWPLKQTKRPARGGGLCKTKLAIENKKARSLD